MHSGGAKKGKQKMAYALVVLAILILVFLICRELICWYWKINEMVSLLTDIRDLLRSLPGIHEVLAADFQRGHPEVSPAGRLSSPPG